MREMNLFVGLSSASRHVLGGHGGTKIQKNSFQTFGDLTGFTHIRSEDLANETFLGFHVLMDTKDGVFQEFVGDKEGLCVFSSIGANVDESVEIVVQVIAMFVDEMAEMAHIAFVGFDRAVVSEVLDGFGNQNESSAGIRGRRLIDDTEPMGCDDGGTNDSRKYKISENKIARVSESGSIDGIENGFTNDSDLNRKVVDSRENVG